MLVGAALASTAFASCRRADAAPPDSPGLTVEYTQADSARVIAKWGKSCDGKGCADAYTVKWSAGTVSRVISTALTLDTFRLARPAFGDSIPVFVAVTPVRRGAAGVARTASAWVRNPDAAPPPVDSLRVDTTATAERTDSLRTDYYGTTGTLISTSADGPLYMKERDTVLLVARLYMKAGETRRITDTLSWRSIRSDDTAPVLSLAAIGPGWAGAARGWAGDTARLIALDCKCVESGSPTNPPRLDLRNGEYVVQDGAGGVRPVTPLDPVPADPFRPHSARGR